MSFMRIVSYYLVCAISVFPCCAHDPIAPSFWHISRYVQDSSIAETLKVVSQPDVYHLSCDDVHRATQYAYAVLRYIDPMLSDADRARNYQQLAADALRIYNCLQQRESSDEVNREPQPPLFNIEQEQESFPESLGQQTQTQFQPTGPIVFPDNVTILGDIFTDVTNISPFLALGGNVGRLGPARITDPQASDLDVAVPAGDGYLLDTTTNALTFIEWGADTVTVTDNRDNFIFVDPTSTIQVSLTRPDEFENILLGKARADNGSVTFIQQIPQLADITATRLNESLQQSLGNIVSSGLIVTENGTTPQRLDVASGAYAYGLLEFEPVGGVPVSSWKAFAGDALQDASQSLVDDEQFDDNGTLAPIPAGEFARHAFYVVGDGSDQEFLLVYSQATFATLNDARNAGVPPKPSSWTGNIVLLASVIVEDGNGIVEVIDERPLGSGEPTGVVTGTTALHNDLSGRNLENNHPQYLTITGSRAMQGTLDMGNFDIEQIAAATAHRINTDNLDPNATGSITLSGPIETNGFDIDFSGGNVTNATTINGIDILNHAARHLPNGADPLTTVAPETIGLSNQEGTANAFARADHIHDHGQQPGGDLHDTATASTAGFLSASDKQLLDNLDTNNFTVTTLNATVGLSADQEINGTMFNVIQFNDEQFDSSGSFDTTNYTFTVPVTGYYIINSSISGDLTGGNIIRQYAVFRNGSQLNDFLSTKKKSGVASLHVIGVAFLQSGDVITMRYAGRDNDDILAGSSIFSIHLLSV